MPATERTGPRVRIVHLDPATIVALAGADLAAANRTAPVELTPFLVEPSRLSTWRFRRDQVRADPTVAGWVTGVIWADDLDRVVGQAGFHGPPDGVGMVEVGYAVEPTFRRRGYGRATVQALLDRARDEPDVRTVRASVSPDNAASLALIAPFGFVQVGEQWDEEDGLELVFEVPAGDGGRPVLSVG